MLIADLEHLEPLSRISKIHGGIAARTVFLNLTNGLLSLAVNGQEVYKGEVPVVPVSTTTPPDSSQTSPLPPGMVLGGFRLRSLVRNSATSGTSTLATQTGITLS